MDVNIKVAVRCRPMSSKERDMGCQCVVQVVLFCILMLIISIDIRQNGEIAE